MENMKRIKMGFGGREKRWHIDLEDYTTQFVKIYEGSSRETFETYSTFGYRRPVEGVNRCNAREADEYVSDFCKTYLEDGKKALFTWKSRYSDEERCSYFLEQVVGLGEDLPSRYCGNLKRYSFKDFESYDIELEYVPPNWETIGNYLYEGHVIILEIMRPEVPSKLHTVVCIGTLVYDCFSYYLETEFDWREANKQYTLNNASILQWMPDDVDSSTE